MVHPSTEKKSGVVVMIGRSNVGKSTLLNSLIGSKIAITTPKAQTTRLPIHGVLTREQGQIVFVDTPGVFKKAKDDLTKTLNQSIKDSLEDIDAILYVVDPTREIGDEEKMALRLIEPLAIPKILVINKTDLPHPRYIDFYRDLAEQFDSAVEVSALHGRHMGTLIERLFEHMPEGHSFYPDHQLTSMSHTKWLAELLREKLFLRLRQEIPYSVHVEVQEALTRPDGTFYIRATIFTTEDRYKRVIIGKGGRGIKEIGQSARRELEAVMDQKVFLDLTVDVDRHWVTRLT